MGNNQTGPIKVPINASFDTSSSDEDRHEDMKKKDEAYEEIAQLKKQIVELKEALAKAEDSRRRAAADLENSRKRFERELERQQALERESILRRWLPVVDNLERALKAEDGRNNPWYLGVEAIYLQMLDILRQFNVQPFAPIGEEFDPERHEAVATVDLTDEPEGKIVEVTENGYMIGDSVLRPAKVVSVIHK
nr:nucleotide exchange factor GrpE [Desulfobacterales bacterium]